MEFDLIDRRWDIGVGKEVLHESRVKHCSGSIVSSSKRVLYLQMLPFKVRDSDSTYNAALPEIDNSRPCFDPAPL